MTIDHFTSLAAFPFISRRTRAAEGVHVVVAGAAVLTRTGAAFVQVCNIHKVILSVCNQSTIIFIDSHFSSISLVIAVLLMLRVWMMIAFPKGFSTTN
jgi:hypothetical protein